MKTKKYAHWLGFFGFTGFRGFEYFSTHNIVSLGYFALFLMFGCFWLGRVANDVPDERYFENSRKAKAVAFNVAVIEFVILNYFILFGFDSKEILTLAYHLCFASLFLSYTIAFYKYEKM